MIATTPKCCDNPKCVCRTNGVGKIIYCVWVDGVLYYVECLPNGKIDSINTTSNKNEVVGIPRDTHLFHRVAKIACKK